MGSPNLIVYLSFLCLCLTNPNLRDIDYVNYNYNVVPVVPHKAVAEVSKIGNL